MAEVAGGQYLCLSLAAVYLQFGRLPPDQLQTTSNGLSLFSREVPFEDFESMRINYVGGGSSFARITFGDLIAGRFDQSLVRNKIVLIGLTATGSDVHPAPIGRLNGIEIQANALDTLLRAQFLQPVGNSTK